MRNNQEARRRWAAFGSAHQDGWHVAFCDGSVALLDYQLDIATASQLANRADGIAVTRHN